MYEKDLEGFESNRAIGSAPAISALKDIIYKPYG